jgi:hypothetical protein|nr:MAG TPA: hypothetical protein [Caudoviricetes sp.]
MNNLLFRNVICKGYLQRKETKHVYNSTIDDEYIEDDVSITLNQGGSCEQEIYEFVEKEFEGICVGIFTKKIKREYVDCVNDVNYEGYNREEQFIHTELKEPIQVAKVFYGNNKSKIVPIDKVWTWQSPF